MLQFITHTIDCLEQVLEGGCRWVQLRIKDASDAYVVALGLRAAEMCRRYDATLIVDDRVHLVRTIEAGGVHLGRNDMPPDHARRILGPGYIVGATANTLTDVQRALSHGADYLGVGPLRFTATKRNLAPLLGFDGYRRITAAGIPVPVVAIGGITLDDLPELKSAGVSGVAVSSLILNSPDPKETTRKIIDIWKNS